MTVMPEISFSAYLRDLLGISELRREIASFRLSQSNRLDNIEDLLHELKGDTMATFKEVVQAIEKNGLLVIEVLNAVSVEAAEIKQAIQASADNVATPDQLSAALAAADSIATQLIQARDTITQLIPTIASPEEPTPPPTEQPIPVPVPTPEPAPVDPGDVVVEPTEPNVGLPDSVAIDVV